MVMFGKDTMVDPKESEWFGFYKPGQGKEMYTLQESPLYQEVCTMDTHLFVILMTAYGQAQNSIFTLRKEVTPYNKLL